MVVFIVNFCQTAHTLAMRESKRNRLYQKLRAWEQSLVYLPPNKAAKCTRAIVRIKSKLFSKTH